jgi:signal transduction histidine kinase
MDCDKGLGQVISAHQFQSSEIRMQNLLDTIAEGIIISSVKGSLIMINSEALRILGLEITEVEKNLSGILELKFCNEWKILAADNTLMADD